MGESHSMMLVQRTIEDVQRHLDVQAKGDLPTAPTLPERQGIGLARTLNRALRSINLHVSRATIHDEAMREVRRGYNPIVKSIALGTILQLQAEPTEFDAVYDALSDEDSRKMFHWFISYRVALVFLGQDADEVIPGIMSTAEWQKALDQTARMFVGNAYRTDGLTVDSGLAEVAASFFLEQYRLKSNVEPRSGDVVLDCGAYRGEMALWIAQKVGKDGRIVAFEPAARSAEGL